MNKQEKEVYDLFYVPKTFERAYRESPFKSQGNFKIYLKNLIMKEYLDEYVSFHNIDNAIYEKRVYRQTNKYKKLCQKLKVKH